MLMIYYRSEEDAKRLLRGRMTQFKALFEEKRGENVSEISDFVMEAHGNMRQLGILERVKPDSIRVIQISDRKGVEHKVDPAIAESIAINGILDDSTREGEYVVIYGRFEKSVVVEAAALNLHKVPGLY